uniref:Uncharacterized protein n=1 Tax=Arundo donax TaxID=35708 RepID=A0A0A9DA29_ARUDO
MSMPISVSTSPRLDSNACVGSLGGLRLLFFYPMSPSVAFRSEVVVTKVFYSGGMHFSFTDVIPGICKIQKFRTKIRSNTPAKN